MERRNKEADKKNRENHRTISFPYVNFIETELHHILSFCLLVYLNDDYKMEIGIITSLETQLFIHIL